MNWAKNGLVVAVGQACVDGFLLFSGSLTISCFTFLFSSFSIFSASFSLIASSNSVVSFCSIVSS